MDVELNDEINQMRLHLDREEACLLYFAVRGYCDKLEADLVEPKTVREHDSMNFFEDAAFLHEQLGKCYKLLFDIIDNHIPSERTQIRAWIRAWMDVI